MNCSDAGIALIKEFEGFPYGGAPYWDPYGKVWTQGYGNTKGVTPHSPRISQAHAVEILKTRLNNEYEPTIEAIAGKIGGFAQHQFDALCSIVWNLGPGILNPSTSLGKALRRKDWKGFDRELVSYDKAGGVVLPGLTRRRRAEVALFITADHTNALEGYTASEIRWIREYDKLLREKKDPDRRRVLVRVMTDQRKRVWRAAQGKSGWAASHRRARYNSLLARTT